MSEAGRKLDWRTLSAPAKEFVEKVIRKAKPVAIYYMGKNTNWLDDVWDNTVHEFIIVVNDQDWEEKSHRIYEIQCQIYKKYSAPVNDAWPVAAVTIDMTSFQGKQRTGYELYGNWAKKYGTLVYHDEPNRIN